MIPGLNRTGAFYIGGTWVAPLGDQSVEIINPATEMTLGRLAMGTKADVDRAVAAATVAFERFSETTIAQRRDLLRAVAAELTRRFDDLAEAMTLEMGAPTNFSRTQQAQSGLDHVTTMIEVMTEYPFEERKGTTLLRREAIGVCGLITPWNWPLNQITCKVAPALAAGCAMVLKPSEIAPLSGLVFAEVMDAAGVPAGVFNLVNGDGPTVGAALSSHPDIAMMSFTGSTRAGIEVARAAAATVKRVAQELGGNSPNIVLEDADLEAAVRAGVLYCMSNTGQSCNSPARMLVPADRMAEAAEIAKSAAESLKVGAPEAESVDLGPVVSAAHFAKVQALIAQAIDEGARLVTGGTGKPNGLDHGYFIKPTVFADVLPTMKTAQTEIFGPVISLIGYRDEAEAITIANDTEYGLAAFVQSGDPARARRVAKRLRAGTVEINYTPADFKAPFGGYEQSGNGREYGAFGLDEFVEVKAILGGED